MLIQRPYQISSVEYMFEEWNKENKKENSEDANEEDILHISLSSAPPPLFLVAKQRNWQRSMSSTAHVALFTERPVEFQVRKTILKGK